MTVAVTGERMHETMRARDNIVKWTAGNRRYPVKVSAKRLLLYSRVEVNMFIHFRAGHTSS
jgi:hypothetical protein